MSPGRAVVVGGGIAGLVAAYELFERGLDVTLFESDSRFGGKIVTSRTDDGLVIEGGADSFLSSKPAGLALCQRLGIGSRLINSRPDDRRTFVWSRGRLRTLPEGLVLGSPARVGGLLRSGLISPAGAARMALDVAVPARRDGVEESIGGFFTRRLGREAYDRVVEPLLAGIHAGDATKLSLPALFPRFVAMERDHGGLVRAALAARRNHDGPAPTEAAGHSPFVSLQGGMGELIEALVAILSSTGATLQSGTRVTDLAPTDAGWRVGVEGGEPVEADAVIMATPAFVTAGLVRSLSPPATALLEGIPHASTATVSLAYRAGDVGGRAPAGYGFVVPRVEARPLIAATWSSNKWPSRVIPGHHVIVRGYVGGVGREGVMSRPDDELVTLVRSELEALAGLTGEPLHTEVHRYPQGMPQYTVGHLERVARIRAELASWPGLAVTGAAYGGVGIPDCITDATATAAAIAATL
ncbi:MAG: protoporphyrinogen oxidase [Acidimicrobiia bacterium]